MSQQLSQASVRPDEVYGFSYQAENERKSVIVLGCFLVIWYKNTLTEFLAAVPFASDSEDDLHVNWDDDAADREELSGSYKASQDTVLNRLVNRVCFRFLFGSYIVKGPYSFKFL